MGNLINKCRFDNMKYEEIIEKKCWSCGKEYRFSEYIYNPPACSPHYKITNNKINKCYLCCYIEYAKEPDYISPTNFP